GRNSLSVTSPVRHESATALMYWWGVSVGVVHRRRKAFGVTRTDSEGSRRLIQAAADKGAPRCGGRSCPPSRSSVAARRRCGSTWGGTFGPLVHLFLPVPLCLSSGPYPRRPSPRLPGGRPADLQGDLVGLGLDIDLQPGRLDAEKGPVDD